MDKACLNPGPFVFGVRSQGILTNPSRDTFLDHRHVFHFLEGYIGRRIVLETARLSKDIVAVIVKLVVEPQSQGIQGVLVVGHRQQQLGFREQTVLWNDIA